MPDLSNQMQTRTSSVNIEVIKGIDLTIEDGEFCVFVGPSGCGKSTLLRMIAGLEDITDGTFAIDGAIVGQPETFLFDEPLSNLDAELRVHMRTQISELHSRLKRTMIYVTHDQVEAMTLADKIVLLRGGKIEQVGSPRDLYERPQNLFAAQFIGAPKMNIFELEGDFSSLRERLRLPADAHYCGIRPDSFDIVADGDGILSVTVRLVEYLGNACLVHAEIKGHDTIIIEQPVGTHLSPGNRISLSSGPDAVHVFSKDGCVLASQSRDRA